MRMLLGIVVGLACAVGLWLALGWRTGSGVDAPAPTPPGTESARLADLEQRLDRLEAELQRLAADPVARSPAVAPATFVAPPADVRRSGDGIDARWYLLEYVRSFDGGGGGSDYFRLAVDAYAPQLLDEICRLVRDGSADEILRAKLAAMLGTPRFARNAAAIDALLAMLRTGRQAAAQAALGAIAVIAEAQTAIALERMVWGLDPTIAAPTLAVMVKLAGPDANRALQRLFATATTAAQRALVLAGLSAVDADAALELFRKASQAETDVRLQAAGAIRRFRGDAFRAFIDQWLGYESDARVREMLGEVKKRMSEVPPYAPQKAAGPPDATPAEDHPNAWASAAADMGLQWLELAYEPARRASGVRIHEVCVAGAVVKVVLVDETGGRHQVWAGVDPTQTPGVFDLRFAATRYRVKAVRIVLDTDLRPGWSEIDAVELVGPDGNAWAKDATASSAYGQ